MVKNYFELKLYNYKKRKQTFIFILLFVFVITFVSNIKISKYISYSLVKENNELYIKCDYDCDVIKKRKTIFLNNQSIKYLYKTKVNNLYKITLLDKVKIINSTNVKMCLQKERAYNALLNIFKKKGVK